MASTVSDWLRSTFLKRRWTVLTLAPLLVIVAQWLINHFSALPSDLRSAAAWEAPLWLYGLSFTFCLNVAQVLGWREQHGIVKEMTGQPSIALSPSNVSEGFIVRSSGKDVAVDVTVQDIVIPIPAKILEQEAKMIEDSGIQVVYPSPKSWIVKFQSIASVIDGDITPMDYRIQNVGVLQAKDIKNVMAQIATDFDVDLPLTLAFSNLNGPKRTWHSHYVVNYNLISKALSLRHVGTAIVKDTQCSLCAK